MEDGALASTVPAKQKRDRPQRDVLTFADAFEVFDSEVGDHVRDSKA